MIMWSTLKFYNIIPLRLVSHTSYRLLTLNIQIFMYDLYVINYLIIRLNSRAPNGIARVWSSPWWKRDATRIATPTSCFWSPNGLAWRTCSGLLTDLLVLGKAMEKTKTNEKRNTLNMHVKNNNNDNKQNNKTTKKQNKTFKNVMMLTQ